LGGRRSHYACLELGLWRIDLGSLEVFVVQWLVRSRVWGEFFVEESSRRVRWSRCEMIGNLIWRLKTCLFTFAVMRSCREMLKKRFRNEIFPKAPLKQTLSVRAKREHRRTTRKSNGWEVISHEQINSYRFFKVSWFTGSEGIATILLVIHVRALAIKM